MHTQNKEFIRERIRAVTRRWTFKSVGQITDYENAPENVRVQVVGEKNVIFSCKTFPSVFSFILDPSVCMGVVATAAAFWGPQAFCATVDKWVVWWWGSLSCSTPRGLSSSSICSVGVVPRRVVLLPLKYREIRSNALCSMNREEDFGKTWLSSSHYATELRCSGTQKCTPIYFFAINANFFLAYAQNVYSLDVPNKLFIVKRLKQKLGHWFYFNCLLSKFIYY